MNISDGSRSIINITIIFQCILSNLQEASVYVWSIRLSHMRFVVVVVI